MEEGRPTINSLNKGIDPPRDFWDRLEERLHTPVSRRGVLKVAGIATLVATGAVGLTACGPNGETNSSIAPTEQTQQVDATTESKITVGDVSVYFKDGIPTRWKDARGGQGEFDEAEMVALREKARFEGDQVAGMMRLPDPEIPIHTETGEKLRVPDDVLSAEQLAARGIEIIQSENKQMYLRPSMFEPGGLLELYQEGSGNKLKIVLLDTPVIRIEAFEDPRYASVREVFEHLLAVERVAVEGPPEGELEDKKRYLQAAVMEDGYVDFQEAKELAALNLLTPEDVQKYWLWPKEDGVTYPAEFPQNRPQADTSFVILALGEKVNTFKFAALTVDTDGHFSLGDFELKLDRRMKYLDEGAQFAIRTEDAYPNVEDFPLIEINMSSVGERIVTAVDPIHRTPGFTAVHELAHDYLARQVAPTERGHAVEDEVGADRAALEHIRKAQERRVNGDDRGHGTVLKDVRSEVVVAYILS